MTVIMMAILITLTLLIDLGLFFPRRPLLTSNMWLSSAPSLPSPSLLLYQIFGFLKDLTYFGIFHEMTCAREMFIRDYADDQIFEEKLKFMGKGPGITKDVRSATRRV